jgi:hypothetical protein
VQKKQHEDKGGQKENRVRIIQALILSYYSQRAEIWPVRKGFSSTAC